MQSKTCDNCCFYRLEKNDEFCFYNRYCTTNTPEVEAAFQQKWKKFKKEGCNAWIIDMEVANIERKGW